MRKYVRWLGWHSIVTASTFQFEMSRGTECCAEVLVRNWSSLAENSSHVWVGLLCDPKGIVREFHNDAWSELSGTQLQRGKDGCWRGNKCGNRDQFFTHTEAWVKPGNFAGIVIMYPYELPRRKRELVKQVSRKYSLPIYRLTSEGLKREAFK